VQNAVPLMGFDNLMPTYQTIKAMCRHYSDLVFDEDHMVIVSPDFGGMNRNFLYANELGLEIGLFYKRRDTNEIKNGKNSIVVHKYIGPDLTGKDVLITDDVIATGESMLDSVAYLKKSGAKRIFIGVTFGLFTDGTEKFDQAYKDGVLDSVFVTNATYVREEVLKAPWYKEVNLTKYIALYIFSVNAGTSISSILNPHEKISDLLKKYRG